MANDTSRKSKSEGAEADISKWVKGNENRLKYYFNMTTHQEIIDNMTTEMFEALKKAVPRQRVLYENNGGKEYLDALRIACEDRINSRRNVSAAELMLREEVQREKAVIQQSGTIFNIWARSISPQQLYEKVMAEDSILDEQFERFINHSLRIQEDMHEDSMLDRDNLPEEVAKKWLLEIILDKDIALEKSESKSDMKRRIYQKTQSFMQLFSEEMDRQKSIGKKHTHKAKKSDPISESDTGQKITRSLR